MTRFSAALLMVLGLPAICDAGLTFNLVENAGGQVTLTYSGSIVTSDLTGISITNTIASELDPSTGKVAIAGSVTPFQLPSATATNSSFGTTGSVSFVSVAGGSSPVSFSLSSLNTILLPASYTSGASISGSAVLAGSLSSIGATVGTYTISWSGGTAGRFITLIVANNNTGGSPAAVPEPGTLLLGGIGSLVSGIAYRRRQRKAAAAGQSAV
jgi:hypothetical protein